MYKFVFGITGGTGAGKSTVSGLLRKKGVKVIDADSVSRAVTQKGTPCLKELTGNFGENILNTDKTLNRRLLGSIVFNDKKKLELLTSITHKYIKEHIEKEISSAQENIIAIDGAVIIGSPVMNLCKKLVVVTADKDVRLNRIIKRDNITEDAARNRIESQMSDEEYLSHADYVIENDGNSENIGVEIERIYSEIKNISKAESKKN